MAYFAVVLALSLSLLMVFGNGYCQSEPESTTDEFQVLIDVSGSMKQNDPLNLRKDATQLLVNLLPDHARVSLWLFAEKPALLTQSQSVDEKWKQQAVKASEKIHARGLYTHIEEAIDNALRNGFDANGNKNLIVLTDGMVDISKDIMVSADSRERILSEWIPRLQQRQIKVQTIALSDQADRELLERLAYETGGWTEIASSAEQLQRAFLKTALKAAPKDALPLTDNRFHVDSSVKEFSVLVFKTPQARPTQLLTPHGKPIDKHDQTVSWLENSGYDLITVKQPQAGDWRIDAAVDPDNQVMILTDLKLQIEELPNIVGAQQSLELKAHFTEQGKLLTRADFLGLIGLSLSIDQQPPTALKPDSHSAGYFLTTLPNLPAGKHTLAVIADGKTFDRKLEREIDVLATVIHVETVADKQKRLVTLKFEPDAALLDKSALKITARIQPSGHEALTREIENKDGIWELVLADLPAGSSTQIHFDVMAKSPDGKAMSPTLPPIVVDDSTFAANGNDASNPSALEEASSEESHQAGDAAPPADADHAGNMSWLTVIAIVIAVNLLIAGAGFLIYKAIKKANAKKQQQVLERLS